MQKINNIEELKQAAAGKDYTDMFIRLQFGLKSSKGIMYNPDTDVWNIYNEIDDTEQTLSTEELGNNTNILKALETGNLFKC